MSLATVNTWLLLLLRLRAARLVAAVETDLILQLSPCEEVINVLQRGLRDIAYGLAGEESLMRCDYHIVECKQSRQYVISQHPVREILEEELALLLVNIEPRRPDLPALEPLYKISCPDQLATAGVD